jgi:hypothetical protein
VPSPLTDRRRFAVRAIAATVVLVALLVRARDLDPLANGLRAQYFANIDWSGAPSKTFVEAAPSTAALVAAAGGGATRFSASWSGWVIAPRDDAYTFATTSDDGSWVYVDNEMVVDNGGAHPQTTRTGPTIRLTRGPHAVFVRYFQNEGDVELTWLWQRGAGRFDPVPAWALRPRRVEYARFAADRALETAAAAAPWIGVALVLAALLVGFRPEVSRFTSQMRGLVLTLWQEGAWPALGWIVLGSAALNIVGLWWGLPRGTWMGDELIPIEVMSASAMRFMHGWHDKYPPVQYYILNLAYAPVLGLDAVVDLPEVAVETMLIAVGRAVSVVMAAAAIAATFFCGRRAFGPRAGLFAAAMLALVVPFSYYAKAANVDMPYLMWFAICLFFYLRVLDGGTGADAFWWAATGTLAVCTKDQAGGLMILMPAVVVAEQARANARAGRERPWLRAVFDRRIGVAAITALAVFALCHNILLNADGFAGHIRMILQSEAYQAYPSTAAGRLMLLNVTLRLIARNFGWPMLAVVAAGVVAAFVAPERRRTAVHLIVPIVSYYLAFIDVILFAYDRFLLPVCLILALFGGYALDRFTAGPAPFVRWRRAIVAIVFAYAILYSATVDALMLTDARHIAERWLDAHVRDGDEVAISSVATYMPRLSRLSATEVYDREKFDRLRPRFFILNPDYTLTEPPDTELGRIIRGVRDGTTRYRLVLEVEPSRPLDWLPGGHPDLVGDRRDPKMLSFLRNISPRIEVYERQ